MNEPQSSLRPDRASPPPLNIPFVVIVFVAICTLVELIRTYLVSPETDAWLMYSFAFIPARYDNPQLMATWQAIVSPFSYSLFHGNFAHLINNCLWLIVFGSPLAATIGAMRFVAFWFICALIGAAFHFLALQHDIAPMIGASGAVSGMMGAAARFGLRMVRQTGRANRFMEPPPAIWQTLRMPNVLLFLGFYLVLNVGIGLTNGMAAGSQIAWQAHIGGIFAGFLLTPWFSRVRR